MDTLAYPGAVHPMELVYASETYLMSNDQNLWMALGGVT